MPVLISILLSTAGCAAASEPTAVVSAAARPVRSPAASVPQSAPLVDHHQHLLSPALAALFNGPPDLAAVSLPQPLIELLRLRASRWNDRDALRELYANDALLALNEGPASGLLRGPDAIAGFLSRRFSAPYRLTPVSYVSSGNLASITGYYTRADTHISSFQLTLQRNDAGDWRIASEIPTFRGMAVQQPIDASDLIGMLDEAGIRRAVVLSGAFGFGSRNMDVTREQETSATRQSKVRAENDWIAQQVALYPDRLIAFCSFSPLEPYALAELDRCAESGSFRGVKLHLDESAVDLSDPEHVSKVRAVFAAADRQGLPLIVHVGNNQAEDGAGAANRANVETFLREIVAAAPNVVVQIAHLWGGQGFSEAALAAYADAMSSRTPGTAKLYFDIAEAPLIATQYGPRQREILETVAMRIRQIGLDRILYGSDGAIEGHLPPAEAWAQFRASVPLTEDELRAIATNVAPYMH